MSLETLDPAALDAQPGPGQTVKRTFSNWGRQCIKVLAVDATEEANCDLGTPGRFVMSVEGCRRFVQYVGNMWTVRTTMKRKISDSGEEEPTRIVKPQKSTEHRHTSSRSSHQDFGRRDWR
jgi:hypothetical protein